MANTLKQQREERVATAFASFSHFLTHPHCGRCEVLEICFRRLQDDGKHHRSAYPKEFLQALRRSAPFRMSHTPARCGRCLPAEMLMRYLTPEKSRSTVSIGTHGVTVGHP